MPARTEPQSPDPARRFAAAPGAEADPARERRAGVSAAMDGDAEALAEACRGFRDDAELRGTWHAYHLIGDVMRSSELANAAPRDAEFLASLRQRLADEPVVLAPQPLAVPVARRRWAFPAAAAAGVAGVAVVAGALVMSRTDGLDSAPGVAAAPSVLQAVGPTGARPVARNGVLRDERLDEFLRVHQGTHGGFALPRPETRPVDLQATPR
jgi:sigma-E factor negative regulatory protein RseA